MELENLILSDILVNKFEIKIAGLLVIVRGYFMAIEPLYMIWKVFITFLYHSFDEFTFRYANSLLIY